MRLSSALVVLSVLSLASGVAGADDALHFKTPATCTTEGGSTVDLTPGRYLPEDTWQDLDAEYRMMEERITRLEAENSSLTESVSGVSWGWAAAGLVAGGLAGKYLWGD